METLVFYSTIAFLIIAHFFLILLYNRHTKTIKKNEDKLIDINNSFYLHLVYSRTQFSGFEAIIQVLTEDNINPKTNLPTVKDKAAQRLYDKCNPFDHTMSIDRAKNIISCILNPPETPNFIPDIQYNSTPDPVEKHPTPGTSN